MDEFAVWLCSITVKIPVNELRLMYKGDTGPVLEAVLEHADQIRIGTTDLLFENERQDAVVRVLHLLDQRGTETWPPQSLPLLDASLEREIIAAFMPRADDPPFEVATVDSLLSFLRRHRGTWLATRSV